MKQTYLHLHFKKLLHFFLKSSQKRTLSILATLAIVLAIPITIVTLGKQQTLFQHAADSPASGPIVAADASYSAGVPGCGDNPTVPPGGVKQFYVWKTSCSVKCDTNADCPQNTTDPNVKPETSNWCWGFNLGNGHTANRCMMLHSYGGLGNSADGQIHQANGCSDSALTDCVLHWRPDILPYYLKVSLDTTSTGTGQGQWTGACAQQRQIVQNWKGIDPQGYNDVVSKYCQNVKDGIDASYNTNIPTGGKNQAVVCCTDDSSCNGGKCSAYGNVEASVCPSRMSCIAGTGSSSSSNSTSTISNNTTPSFTIGMNVTGITDYASQGHVNDVDADLTAMQNMGATIIRVWVANDQISNDEAASRLNSFLTKAASHNISAIVSFIDLYDTSFHPQGTDQYYQTDNTGRYQILRNNFFNGGYQGNYKTFVRTVINANKNHSNIYAWEPGNELKDENNTGAFINFMSDMTKFIKSLDPTHAVATGMIRAGHTNLSPDQLYSALPSIDIITVHSYNGDHSGLEDVRWALSHGKKAIVEEIGFDGNGNRSNNMDNEIKFWRKQGVTAVLQWGFIAKGLRDNGNGDSSSGMDTIWHNADYNSLSNVFSSFSQKDITQSTTTPITNTVNTNHSSTILTATPTLKPTSFDTQNTSHTTPTTQSGQNGYDCTRTCQYEKNGSWQNGWCVKSAGDNCGENINCGFSSVCAGR